MLQVDTCALRHCETGEIITLPRPARHYVLGREARARGCPRPWCKYYDQGFLLSDGTYATRIRAAQVALASGQIKALAYSSIYLFSEDLW